ncbi:Histone methylation protein DOT1 [Hoeflea sp. IMCC20628]|nr:Histone methylation protein DOT1 [Hoeflea sp. IMCC20628]
MCEFHNGSDKHGIASEISRIFEIPDADEIDISELYLLHKNFGVSNYTYEGTSLLEAREIFHAISLAEDDIFLDIGAGYGAIVLYGAAIFPAAFIAVEAVRKRADHIERVSGQLGMRNLHVRHQGAEVTDLATASHVFLNNPFLGSYAKDYVYRLAREIKKECAVIALNNIVAEFRESPLFSELETSANIPNYRFGLFVPA